MQRGGGSELTSGVAAQAADGSAQAEPTNADAAAGDTTSAPADPESAEPAAAADAAVRNPYATDFYAEADKAADVTSIVLPATVESIDPAFFQLFPNAASIAVDAGNSAFTSYNGMLFGANDAGDPTDLLLVPEGMEGAAVLPHSMATVPACVFSRCTKLSAISQMGDTASARFATENGILYSKDLTGEGEPGGTLTLVAAPAGMGASASIATACDSIGAGAFLGNEGLKTIVASGKVTAIAMAAEGDSQPTAFNDAALQNATVLTAERAAWEAAGFTSFAAPAEPGEVLAPAPGDSGLTYTLLDSGQLSVRWTGDAPASGERTIPRAATLHGVDYTVAIIEDGAFEGQEELTAINLPDTITAIGSSAFAGCTNLAAARIPTNTATIGERAFAGTALQAIIMPATVATIGAEAFADNPDLRTVVALDEPADIASSALAGCTDVAVYAPYRADGDYPWSIGAPAAANHLMPYGAQVAPGAIQLHVGNQADLFETGYLEAPGDIEVATSYRSCISVADDRIITAKQPGSTPVVTTLTLNGQLLAATTGNVTVTMPAKVAEEAAEEDTPAEGEETEAESSEISVEENGIEDPAEFTELQLLSNEPEAVKQRMINLTADLVTGETAVNAQEIDAIDAVFEETTVLQEIAATTLSSEADIMPYASVGRLGTFYVNPNGGKATIKYLYKDFSQGSDVPIYTYREGVTTTVSCSNTAWSWTMYITQNGIAVHRWEDNSAWVRTSAGWDSDSDLGSSGSDIVADNITQPIHATILAVAKTGYHPTKITNSSGVVLLTNERISDSNTLEGTSGFAASTYTPTWEANSYSIQFNKGDGTGTMASQSMKYDTAATLKASTFTPPTGKHFKQWKGSDGKTYTDKQSVKNLTATNNGTVTLTAEYEANTNTVTFRPNFPSGPSSDNVAGTYPDVTATYGQAIPKPKGYVRPSKKGYTFNGWYDGTGSTANKYLNADGTPAKNGITSVTWDKTTTGTKTLYGRWTPISYTVSLNLNGGSKNIGTNGSNLPSSKTVSYYQTIELDDKYPARTPNGPTAGTGKYTFGGFVANSDGSGSKYIASAAYGDPGSHESYDILAIDSTCSAWTTAGNGTIYAKWDYSITYNANGGTGSIAATSATYNRSVTLSSGTGFSYANKVFTGWNTQADGKGASYSESQSVSNLGSRTLYAQWEDKKTTAIFNPNDGTSYDTARLYSQELPLNTKTNITATQSAGGILIVPQRIGYKFEGYYDKQVGGTQYFYADTTDSGAVTSSSTLIATRNWDKTDASTVLYAHWTPKIYKITLSNKDATTNGTDAIWLKYNTGFYTGAACEPSQVLTKAKLVKPQRTGYAFYGYPNICDGDGNLLSDYTVFTSATTVDPKWEGKVFRITLSAGAGASSLGTRELYLKYGTGYYSSGTVSNGNDAGSVTGNKVGSISKPERDGYDFGGYGSLIAANGAVNSGTSTLYTKDTSLPATWNAKTTYLVLDPQGGTQSIDSPLVLDPYTTGAIVAAMPVRYDSILPGSANDEKAKIPTRTGYDFEGYYEMPNGVGKKYYGYKTVGQQKYLSPVDASSVWKSTESRITLYAKWTPRTDTKYTIQYYYQDKDGVWPKTPTYTASRTGETDKRITISGADVAVSNHASHSEIPEVTEGKERYVRNNNDSGKNDTLESTILADGSTVFKVHYAIQFKVTYEIADLKKGTLVPVPGDDGWRLYNRQVGKAADVKSGAGYEFVEWSPSHNAANAVVKAMTYIAQFKTINYYLLLHTDGGQIGIGSSGGFQPGGGDSEWEYSQADYHCTYNVESQPIALPISGTEASGGIWKDGYTFLGWTGDDIGSTPVANWTVPTGSTGEKDFYANWRANTYTIEFDLNKPANASMTFGGNMEPQKMTCDQTTKLRKNAFTGTNYTFKGWSATKLDGTTVEYSDEELINTNDLCVTDGATVVLRAVWEPNKVTIVFYANTQPYNSDVVENIPDSFMWPVDTPFEVPGPAPERAGYEFKGWKYYVSFEDELAEWRTSLPGEQIIGPTGNHTTYLFSIDAQWEPLTYTVTYDKNLGDYPDDNVSGFPNPASFRIAYREKQNLSDAQPMRVGYEFAGWALAKGSTEADYGSGAGFQHGIKPDGTAMDDMPGDVTLYAVWEPVGLRMNFYKFTDKEYPNSICSFTSAFTGPIDFELNGEPMPIELPTDRTMRTDCNKVDVPGYFLYGWTWVSDWSGIDAADRWRYILPTDTDMREIVVDKMGITDPALRDIDLYAVWQMTYHFDVPGDATVATLVLDASEKETWRASDVALLSTTPCPVEVEAWSEVKPTAADVFPSTDLAQVDFLYDIGQGRDNPQLALDGSERRVQQIGTVPAGTAAAASRLAGQLSITFRDKNQVNISQKVTPDDSGMVMNGTVWDEPIAQIHWLLSMDPADALTHTLLAVPPDAADPLPGFGEAEVEAAPSARPDDPGQ